MHAEEIDHEHVDIVESRPVWAQGVDIIDPFAHISPVQGQVAGLSRDLHEFVRFDGNQGRGAQRSGRRSSEAVYSGSASDLAFRLAAAASEASLDDLSLETLQESLGTNGGRRLKEWQGLFPMSTASAVIGDQQEALVFTVGESLHATSSRADGDLATKGGDLLRACNSLHEQIV